MNISNHRSLRAELDAAQERQWRGHSDTETLLEVHRRPRPRPYTVKVRRDVRLCTLGQAAAKIVPRPRSVRRKAPLLWVDRPRLRFRFGVEVAPDASPIYRRRLADLRCGPSSDEATYRHRFRFTGIYPKLEPGCILEFSPEALGARPAVAPRAGYQGTALSIDRYWSYREVVVDGLAQPYKREEEAADHLHEALGEAIKGQSIADVPIGAFLSGGLDSSLIVDLYQKYSPQPVRTFSIGFEEARALNEAGYAKSVASHFGTQHNKAL